MCGRLCVAALASAAVACTASHAIDDASVTDGGLDAEATDAALEPCGWLGRRTAVLDLLCVTWGGLCAPSQPWCSPEPPAPDGLSIDLIAAIAPLEIVPDGADLILDAVVAHRTGVRYTREDAPPLIAARVRYRIRLDAAPFAAIEEVVAIDPAAAVTELLRAADEPGCVDRDPRRPPLYRDPGRMLCASSGGWDAWAHSVGVEERYGLALHEPQLPALVLVDRETRQWFLVELQGIPESCFHEATVIPSEPCRPSLGVGEAYATYGYADLDVSTFHGLDYGYCPLQLSCVRCCPSDVPPFIPPGFYTDYECWNRGFVRCDENAAWLDAACAATSITDLPPAATPPCRNDDAYVAAGCGFHSAPGAGATDPPCAAP